MRADNSYNSNAYLFVYILALFLLSGFLLACSSQNIPQQNLPAENQIQISVQAININTATAEELGKLPHIGEQTARTIIEHREKFGSFRKPEHLMLVRGISDRRFRAIRNLIKVE
jgi:competence ComEA-like helix-hairpin-helix protein